MRIRSFIIAYALVLAILLFADRRPGSMQQDRYSHVVDLTDGLSANTPRGLNAEPRTHIIAPDELIPGTWTAGQIPPERLVAPLIVMDLNADLAGRHESSQRISLDDIAAWETHHGMVPPGSVVAIRRQATAANGRSSTSAMPLPIERDAAQFLVDARSTIGFAVETPVNLSSDRPLGLHLALRGNYVIERAARFNSLPATGSLIIVAPEKGKKRGEGPVRILAMVR